MNNTALHRTPTIRPRLCVRFVAAVHVAFAAVPATAAAQQLEFTPYRASGIYDLSERVGWAVATAPGQEAPSGMYRYTVMRDGLAVIDSGTFELPQQRATIETSLDRPGMVLVEVQPPAGNGEFRGASRAEVGRALLGAAVVPARIEPSAPRPADFDAFWDAKIRLLERVPAEPQLTPGASDRPEVEYYTIRMDNVDGAHVYGQLAKPAHGAQLPALLILQWASPPYPLRREWVTDRAAQGWLVLNVQPHDVPTDMPQAFYDALPQRIKNYPTIGQHSRDESYFLPMYLGDYRAVEYLASREDWDGRTVVVMGTSMGGQQSIAVAGLHPKVTAVLVNVPSGSDVTGPLHGRAAPYPTWDVTRPEVRETARYFDPVNFASRIEARALVGIGFIDETSTPAGIWAAFNVMRGPKEVVSMVDSPHNHLATPAQQRAYVERAEQWLAALARGRSPLPGRDRNE
jgi:cephalosporin-C deacetylase-like acetyl esterase